MKWLAGAVMLALAAGSVHADPKADPLRAEGLLQTTPAGLSAANLMLTKAFVRGNKDIDAYTYLQKLLVQHTLALAEKDGTQEPAYLGAAIRMTYNLASNTWPGWGDEFVVQAENHHRRIGIEAARLNIELAERLGLGPERRKNGYWILGGHHLANGEYVAALEAYDQSRRFADAAQDEEFELTVTGWMHLTSLVRGEDRNDELDSVLAKLEVLSDDGRFYAEQIKTARTIFQN